MLAVLAWATALQPQPQPQPAWRDAQSATWSEPPRPAPHGGTLCLAVALLLVIQDPA